MPIFAVTAPAVLDARRTTTAALSTLPAAIIKLLTLPARLPFATVIGSVKSNGAPVGSVALTIFEPTFSRDTISGIGSTVLPDNWSVINPVKPEKIPSGRLLSWLFRRSSDVSENIPAKSLLSKDVTDLLFRLSDVIVARSVSLKFRQSVTPGTTAVIAAATCGVRLHAPDFVSTYPK